MKCYQSIIGAKQWCVGKGSNVIGQLRMDWRGAKSPSKSVEGIDINVTMLQSGTYFLSPFPAIANRIVISVCFTESWDILHSGDTFQGRKED